MSTHLVLSLFPGISLLPMGRAVGARGQGITLTEGGGMKYWLRHFKTQPDVVAAETEEEAERMDSSDACDSVEVDYVSEIDKRFLDRSHPSWREYIPAGDPDYRTLAEIFDVPTVQPEGTP